MKKIYALILFACIANALATPFAHAHAPVIVNSAYCDNLIAQSHSPLYTITKNKRSATLLGTAAHNAAVLNDLIQEKYAALLATSDVLVTESGVPDYSVQASWVRTCSKSFKQ